MTPSCGISGVMTFIYGLIRSPEMLQHFCITDQMFIIQSLMQHARYSRCKLYSCRVGFQRLRFGPLLHSESAFHGLPRFFVSHDAVMLRFWCYESHLQSYQITRNAAGPQFFHSTNSGSSCQALSAWLSSDRIGRLSVPVHHILHLLPSASSAPYPASAVCIRLRWLLGVTPDS